MTACINLEVETTNITEQPSYGPTSFNEPGFTAIVVAYEPEMKGILSTLEQLPQASITATQKFKGVTYHLGSYEDHPILVFATGMSIANAAMTMQMALDYFPVDEVVYMGIAGAVDPKWQPGDVIIPERWYYHDESVYINPDPAQPDSYLLPDYYHQFLTEQDERRKADPHTPKYKNYGMIHPDEVVVIRDGMSEPEDKAYFTASPRLVAAAKDAIEDLPPQYVLNQRQAVLQAGGNGVTGSVFLDNREYRRWVHDVFAADVTEMESAAIGQVCYINDVDWIIIRAISDLAGGQEEGEKNVENLYDEEVSRIGAKVLFAVIDEITD